MDKQSLAADLAALRADLSDLRDRQEIRECLYRYAHAVDRHDWAQLEKVYHPDAIANHGDFAGSREELIAWLDRMFAGLQAHTHHVTNHICEIDGDTAHCESYAIFMTQRIDGPTVTIGGARYIDRVERRNGAWKIALRRITLEWICKADALDRTLGGYPAGSWDSDDLSNMRPLQMQAPPP
jgi:ketosteroid isomerase-like protein